MESQIKKLKQKYWEGKTSLQEEINLKTHFHKDLPLDNENAFFKEINKRKSVQADIQFVPPKRRNKMLWQLSSVAATIAIIIAFTINYRTNNNDNQFVVDDPQQAYEISMQALMMVSSELNKGKIYSTRMDKVNEIKQLINK